MITVRYSYADAIRELINLEIGFEREAESTETKALHRLTRDVLDRELAMIESSRAREKVTYRDHGADLHDRCLLASWFIDDALHSERISPINGNRETVMLQGVLVGILKREIALSEAAR
jgi:hypothetical protein